MRFDELTEQPVEDGSTEIVKDFVKFASERLGLTKPPKIKLIRDPKAASVRRSFGGYMPGMFSIEINTGNRHIMDVLRTLAHEMVHYKQDLNNELKPDSGKDGSPQENEANAKAAVIMRLWGKMNPELFQHAALLAESWSKKYKSSINCASPKGFSQKAHCAGKKKSEDYHPNATPPGPETKPTMPAGTVRVDVDDVYDWYKLGQHISNMKGLGKHDFGKGPPSTIFSFGDEETEHKYIQALKQTGLTTTDIDPVDPNQPKGMRRQKTDPTYNVGENMDHSKDSQAVPQLKSALLARKEKLQSATDDQVYDIINKIMTRIAKAHGLSGQELHDMWVKQYKQIPDTWIMK